MYLVIHQEHVKGKWVTINSSHTFKNIEDAESWMISDFKSASRLIVSDIFINWATNGEYKPRERIAIFNAEWEDSDDESPGSYGPGLLVKALEVHYYEN